MILQQAYFHEGHDHGQFGDDHDFEHDDDFDGAASKSEFYYADNIELVTVGIDIGSSTSHWPRGVNIKLIADC